MANCTGCPFRWHDSDCEYCSMRNDEILDLTNYSKETCPYYQEYEKSRGDSSSSGGSSSSSSGGCYVATCVYGSYNCPEVWTLRRYRDDTLANNIFGRAFVRTYYAVSPTIVKLFGNTKLFKKFFRKRLDKMVNKLLVKGVENTPYEDRSW